MERSVQTRAIVVWFALSTASAVHSATVTLVPSKDNTIIQWSPETPSPNPYLANGKGDIFVGRNNFDGQGPATVSIRRGLVHFDLSMIPAGATILDATLTIRDVRGMNGDRLVSLHRMLNGWGEGNSYFNGGQGASALDGDVTWLHSVYHPDNPLTSVFWNTPGGDFTPVASAQTVVSDDFGDGHLFSWSGSAMLADLQLWIDEPAANFGWVLRGDEENGQTAKRLDSREPETESDVPPMLEIEYEPALAGDFNDDGQVNAGDYTLWRNRLGASIRLPNETTTFGSVTIEDYEVWKANFAELEVGAEIVAVSHLPEPSSGWITAGGLVGASAVFGRWLPMMTVRSTANC